MHNPGLKKILTCQSLPARAPHTFQSAQWPQEHPGAAPDRPSQRHRLSKHSFPDARPQAPLGHDIDFSLQHRLQVDQQAAEIKQAAVGSRSTRKSMSLWASVSPRATEPKTRTFRAPRLAATRRISSRLVVWSSCKVMTPLLSLETAPRDQELEARTPEHSSRTRILTQPASPATPG